MTIRLNPRWLLLPALLFSLQFCRAQIVVPPSISFDLGGTNSPASQLWDLNGSYVLNFTVEQPNGTAVPVQLSFTLIQSPSGKLSNPTNEFGDTLTISDSTLAIFPHITGKVTGSDGTARVHLIVRFTGSGTLAGRNVNSFSGQFTIDAETAAATDSPDGIPELVGIKPSNFSASFPGLANFKGQVPDFVAPLLPGVDGTWNLTLDMVALNKVTGTATATTPSEVLGFDLGGAFKGGIFDVKAKGVNGVPGAVNGTGSSAIILLPPDFSSITLNGKILGQKLSFGFP